MAPDDVAVSPTAGADGDSSCAPRTTTAAALPTAPSLRYDAEVDRIPDGSSFVCMVVLLTESFGFREGCAALDPKIGREPWGQLEDDEQMTAG